MNIGTPLTQFDFNDSIDLFSLDVNTVFDECEDIQDVEIITLKQFLFDKAADDAWNITNDVTEIDIIANWLITTKHANAKEFVDIQEHKFIIGVNFEVINKQSINHAFNLLSKIKYLKNVKMVEFGDLIKVYEN